MRSKILGIDVGGSGIKGAPVNVKKGELLSERYRIPTPEGKKPEDIAEVIKQIVNHFNWKGPIGCGFPAAVRDGVALTAANINKKWIGVHIPTLLSEKTGCKAFVINDADAAGLAEMRFGMGKNYQGTVFVVTVGTGLGTAIFRDGKLFPNTEFGHIDLNGENAEWYASDATRKREELKWKHWAKRFNEYLQKMESLLWPRMIIVGGGVSKKHEKFFQYLDVKAEIVPAQLRNEAGIIGAAIHAFES